MKITKTMLTSKVSVTDMKEQNKFLRQIAYWVGYFVFAFNDLENTITQIAATRIDGHLDANQYAYIFLTGMQFNQKVDLLERYYQFNLAYISNKELTKKTEGIIAEIKDLANIRNTIVHANYYSLDNKGNITSKIKFSPSGVEEHLVTITKDFLIENHNKAVELMESLEELDEEITL